MLPLVVAEHGARPSLDTSSETPHTPKMYGTRIPNSPQRPNPLLKKWPRNSAMNCFPA